MIKNLLPFLLVALLIQVRAQHAIIPIPVEYKETRSGFVFDEPVFLDIQSSNKQVTQHAKLFKNKILKTGIELSDTDSSGKKITINLLDKFNSELGDEGYLLTVKADIIAITANKAAGIFYGFQSLQQVIFAAAVKKSGKIEITACKIKDYPRFGWRGLMLDVSRHFFTVDEVKAYIDQMVQYKFNVLHWHLTDDEGWRIEIKSLPKLTEIGAWRVERYGRFGETRPYPKPGEKATYGGFYTHEQIKDIIRYAADRNITIVPEIDVPGHSMAALAAYPELSTQKEPKFVNPGSKFAEWYEGGRFEMLIENMLNPTDEKVYEFLDKVFTEVAELFPGEYIHMGGDECYHGFWEADPTVQQFMKANNLANTHELQSYFVGRVEKIISSKGKKMIGWDEILEGGLTKSAAVMGWRGMKGGIKAAKMGHHVVMTPTDFAYLDYTQGDHSVENPIYADLSLEKTYSFEPIPDGVEPKYILGGQGNLWTEVIPNLPFAFYMTYPRAFALSEVLWSPKENKDWDNFAERTEVHFSIFDANKTNISKAVYEPIIKVYKKGNNLMCQLKNNMPGTEIFYTVDNTYPVQFGKKYQVPFKIPEGNLSLRTQTFRNGKPLGRELIIQRTELEKRVKK